jgi:putative membrane protein
VTTTPPPVEQIPPAELDQARRTSMAAERTWLAWWRSALAASVGALGVGRLAPEVLHVAAWPYVLLGCGYASLAIGLLLTGAQRQRELERALSSGEHRPLQFARSASSRSAALLWRS